MKNPEVDHFVHELQFQSGERHDLIVRIRNIVLDVDPRITEELKYGGILFSAGAPFCGLFSYAQHVSIEFSRGAELADPHGVLEGDGQKRRHIKLRAQPDLFQKNLRDYVGQAFQRCQPVAAKGGRSKPKRRT